MLITTNIYQRVFRLKYGESKGTCFAIEVDGRQYIVTAKHLVESIGSSDKIGIYHDNLWKYVAGSLVGHGGGETDISVLALDVHIAPTHKVYVGGGGEILSQDVYILGFPYGFLTDTDINNGYPIPLVKKGIFSGSGPKMNPLYLDVHNNPGFSGGPVICEKLGADDSRLTPKIIGVVSGYYKGREVFDEDRQLDSNSGITAAYDIRHALDVIEQNPIGFELPPTPDEDS